MKTKWMRDYEPYFSYNIFFKLKKLWVNWDIGFCWMGFIECYKSWPDQNVKSGLWGFFCVCLDSFIDRFCHLALSSSRTLQPFDFFPPKLIWLLEITFWRTEASTSMPSYSYESIIWENDHFWNPVKSIRYNF